MTVPAVSNAFFEQPILNSPYAYPERHWELDEETGQPTQRIIPSRRKADFVTPIPKPRQHAEAHKQAQLGLDDDAGLSTDDQRYARPPSSGRCASKWIVGASCYDALMRVRVSNDLVHWIRFFLNA